jgi:hypothetical protein
MHKTLYSTPGTPSSTLFFFTHNVVLFFCDYGLLASLQQLRDYVAFFPPTLRFASWRRRRSAIDEVVIEQDEHPTSHPGLFHKRRDLAF